MFHDTVEDKCAFSSEKEYTLAERKKEYTLVYHQVSPEPRTILVSRVVSSAHKSQPTLRKGFATGKWGEK